MNIRSEAFSSGETIPSKYTCVGENINPPLAFSDVPAEAETLALIMDDPDAPMGTFVHWVVWNIPASVTAIAEHSSPHGIEGLNGAGKNSYAGPCPPSGEHRYFFKLYALDSELNLAPDTGKDGLEAAMQGHILAQAELMGKFSK